MRQVLLLFTSLWSWILSLIPGERVRTGGWPRIWAEMFSNLWVVPRADGIRYMRFISVLILSLHRMHQSRNEKSLCPVILRVRQEHRALIMRCRHLESLNFWIRDTPFSFFTMSHKWCSQCCVRHWTTHRRSKGTNSVFPRFLGAVLLRMCSWLWVDLHFAAM